jgi:hypothetical protein
MDISMAPWTLLSGFRVKSLSPSPLNNSTWSLLLSDHRGCQTTTKSFTTLNVRRSYGMLTFTLVAAGNEAAPRRQATSPAKGNVTTPANMARRERKPNRQECPFVIFTSCSAPANKHQKPHPFKWSPQCAIRSRSSHVPASQGGGAVKATSVAAIRALETAAVVWCQQTFPRLPTNVTRRAAATHFVKTYILA